LCLQEATVENAGTNWSSRHQMTLRRGSRVGVVHAAG
jgi:hypothetical protein